MHLNRVQEKYFRCDFSIMAVTDHLQPNLNSELGLNSAKFYYLNKMIFLKTKEIY